ncbi:phage tail protein [Oceanisphaera sp. KMM 10153]|uniref:phage tail protein n=1 Tax=Oceanisphaera submarina TaxID=3390193 RepID=UPI0039763E00
MNKPEQVRTLLLSAVPHLKRNPNELHVFVKNGRVVASAAKQNLSFEYQFDLVVVVTDYADHADRIMVPLLAWVAEHQPELITNPDKRESGVRFTVEMINKKLVDIEISLSLTERVKVTPVEGGRTVEHLPEPTDPYNGFDWSLFAVGEQLPPGDE